jgi:hypothetical protein
MLDMMESMTLLLADFVTLRSDWRNILRERDLAGRVNVLRRVGNGPDHRRPRRYYGRHAARRHGDKFVGAGRLWTFEIKFAVTGAATALRVVAFLQVLTNNRRPDGSLRVRVRGVVLAGGLRLQRPEPHAVSAKAMSPRRDVEHTTLTHAGLDGRYQILSN